MGGGELSGKPYEMLGGGGGTLEMNWHFIHGRVAPSRGGGGGGKRTGNWLKFIL